MGSSESKPPPRSAADLLDELEVVATMAAKRGLQMRSGFRSFEERLIAQAIPQLLQQGHLVADNSVPCQRNLSGELRTLLPTSDSESKPKLVSFKEPTRAIVTYADHQPVDSGNAPWNSEEHQPYLHTMDQDPSKKDLIQTWTFHFNQGYVDKCDVIVRMDDLASLEQEYKAFLVKRFQEKNNTSDQPTREGQEIIDLKVEEKIRVVKKRAENFGNTFHALFKASAGAIWYSIKDTTVHKPVFIGPLRQIIKFLEHGPVKSFLQVHSVSNDDGKITINFCTETDSGNKGTQEFVFELTTASTQYIVYKREGRTRFYCMKPLSQFTKEGEFLPGEIVGTAREFIDNATFECQLGKGGYGEVKRYSLNSFHYAVKEINSNTRYRTRDVEIAKRIQADPHPLIPYVYIVEDSMLPYYIIMECCVSDLDTALAQNPHAEQKDTWMKHIFLALEHMHLRMGSNGGTAIISRDVCPRNVLISVEWHAKLTDFSCGREEVNPKVTDISCQKPVGKSGYMAPEVLTRKEHGFKADMFSFGCLMYRTFTRKEPPGVERQYEDGATVEDRIHAHLGDRDNLERQIRSGDIPDDRQDLLLSLIAEEPENRPTHDEARQRRLFKDLPAFKEGQQGVEDVTIWLKRTAKVTE